MWYDKVKFVRLPSGNVIAGPKEEIGAVDLAGFVVDVQAIKIQRIKKEKADIVLFI